VSERAWLLAIGVMTLAGPLAVGFKELSPETVV